MLKEEMCVVQVLTLSPGSCVSKQNDTFLLVLGEFGLESDSDEVENEDAADGLQNSTDVSNIIQLLRDGVNFGKGGVVVWSQTLT